VGAVQYLISTENAEERRMTTAVSFVSSTIGRKVVMALSGIVLFGFVIGHMAGNLQLYLGAHALNEYSVSLREVLHGAGLWIARAVLLVAVGLHIWAATSLTLAERGARPEGYRAIRHRESTYASRTMVWSGPILLLFVAYHLLHFTFGTVHPSFIEGDVYHNVVAGFSAWPVSLFYIVAMLALGLHLRHGVWSMLQTLGLSHPRWNGLRSAFANLFALVVVVGNISMPVAVLSGLVK
jgi:succinate dehydrogenase / fumarate reductase cytochrome b subunit